MLFAESEFVLSEPQSDGASLREHLKLVEENTGIRPEKLNQPILPEIFCALWSYFLELDGARQNNGFGASPISFTELKAWSELTDNKLTPNDVSIIKKLDVLYLNYQAKQKKIKND